MFDGEGYYDLEVKDGRPYVKMSPTENGSVYCHDLRIGQSVGFVTFTAEVLAPLGSKSDITKLLTFNVVDYFPTSLHSGVGLYRVTKGHFPTKRVVDHRIVLKEQMSGYLRQFFTARPVM
jgi:hypothetical protein